MNKKIKLLALFLFTLTIVSFAGCGAKNADELTGKWAYIHDTKTPALVIKANGKAEYNGNSYKYERDDSHIYLTSEKTDSLTFRYELNGDKILLYIPTDYEYVGDFEPEGLEGYWEDSKDNWSYEFTKDYQFSEDGHFFGTYEVNEKDNSITLTYKDDFDKTIIYYMLNGKTLRVEYPWPMVKMK